MKKYSRAFVRVGICVFLPVLCVSCAAFRPPERGIEDLPLPESYTMYGPSAPTPERWWEAFESEELNLLVKEALSDNFTLRQAVARIRQAGAVAKQAGAVRWPDLSYNTEASVTRTHTNAGESTSAVETATQKLNALRTLLSSSPGGTTTGATGAEAGESGATSSGDSVLSNFATGLQTAQSTLQTAQTKLNALETLLSEPASAEMTFTTESYLLGLTTNYEVDLWGRLRASHRSAQLDLAATREDLFAAMQTIVAQVVLTWLDVLLDEQALDVAQQQLATNETNLELIELRYRKGAATALDVFQQRQAVGQAAATIPSVEAQLAGLRHELAVLLGKPPRTDLGLTARQFPEAGFLPEQGLPADLLAQRPDVRAAGLRLRSADWQVSAARADRLPAIRLTGSASYNAEERDLLFDNWMAKLAGSVTGPIFDAGRRKAEVARTRALVDEHLAAYGETVATSVKEVEDALISEAKQGEYINALRAQLEAARASQNEATNRYRKGLSDYLPVLSALTAVQTLERTLIQAEHDRLVYRVQLHLALGGAWMPEGLLDSEV